MDNTADKGSFGLFRESRQSKARLKTRFQSLGSQLLQCLLSSNCQDASSLNNQLNDINVIIIAYQDYLMYIAPETRGRVIERNDSLADLHQIGSYISAHSQQLNTETSPHRITQEVMKIISAYKQLHYLIDKHTLTAHQSSSTSAAIPQDYLIFCARQDIKQFLTNLVYLHNKYSNDALSFIQDMFAKYPQTLENWQLIFTDSEFLKLFNAIFYFKACPDQLFEMDQRPDQILSASTRLAQLYALIEQLQVLVMNKLSKQQSHVINDLLLHGDEIPPGIIIQPEPYHQQIIGDSVKLFQIKSAVINDEKIVQTKSYDLLRAYKIWFNPSRLVDAVMVLQQNLQNSNIMMAFDSLSFKENMKTILKHFKSTDCTDLYAYLMNKDSLHLLRLLKQVSQSPFIEWAPKFDEYARRAVFRVFIALTMIIEAVREELATRGMMTEISHIDYEKPVRNPGRRKREAIKRIINLYGVKPIDNLSAIEDLFQMIETD